MSWIIKKGKDGVSKIYTESEYRENQSIGCLATPIVLVFIALPILFFISIFNIFNIGLISSFGFQQYIYNIMHLHWSDKCILIDENSNYDADFFKDTKYSGPLYLTPIKIPNKNSGENSSSEEYLFKPYPRDIVTRLKYPIMVKYKGYMSLDHTENTNNNIYERTVDWSAISVINDQGKFHGYVRRYLPSATSGGYMLDPGEIVEYPSSGITKYFNIDEDKISGNRFSLIINEDCSGSIVEN